MEELKCNRYDVSYRDSVCHTQLHAREGNALSLIQHTTLPCEIKTLTLHCIILFLMIAIVRFSLSPNSDSLSKINIITLFEINDYIDIHTQE